MNAKKSGGIGIIGIAIATIILIALFGSCGKSESKYDKTFKSGMEKYYSGSPMTKEEHDAVQDYKEWKSKQGEKRYDQW